MAAATFQPGFRFSLIDGTVIAVGSVAAIVLWQIAWWMGFIVAFVVSHFFLFCNLFRIIRSKELLWAASFVVLMYCTVTFNKPSWFVSIGGMLLLSASLIATEMRKPSYHGIFWQRINPDLPDWWAAQIPDKPLP